MENPNTSKIISPALRAALAHATAASRSMPLPSEGKVEALIAKALRAQAALPHPYHNVRHIERVLARARELAAAAHLNFEDKITLLISAAYHDYGHAGATHRRLVDGVVHADLSNEEYAAMCADKDLDGVVPPRLRLAVQGAILATSFGQLERDGLPAPDLHRPYRPHTVVEKLLAFADISNFIGGFEEFVGDNIAVMEEGGVDIPENFTEFLSTRLGFLSYARARLAEVVPLLPAALGEKLQAAFGGIERQIRELQESPQRDAHPWALALKAIREKKTASKALRR